ncbi:hypothetical protein IAI10_17510 [Clostridium sp. 19966]|nr:hypothetical protein [Clostridium sp. 19966]MDT8718465.1 hypothetical protein [Clostridium sp. 19966]
MADYVNFVFKEIHGIPCEFDFSWKGYKEFAIILDKRYEEFCKSQK